MKMNFLITLHKNESRILPNNQGGDSHKNGKRLKAEAIFTKKKTIIQLLNRAPNPPL